MTDRYTFEVILHECSRLGVTRVRCLPGQITVIVDRSVGELSRALARRVPFHDVAVYRDTETEEFRREYYGIEVQP